MADKNKSEKKVNQKELNNIVDRLNQTHTISSKGGEPEKQASSEDKISKKKNAGKDEVDTIIDRLAKTHTISSNGGLPEQQAVCKDIISKKTSGTKEVEDITLRLHRSHTICSGAEDGDQSPSVVDKISAPPVPKNKLDEIIERMNTTHTISSEGSTKPRKTTDNSISRPPADDDELGEIYSRLHSTQTKSSKGGEDCRTYDPRKPPGMGLPMYPEIEGIDKRFAGFEAPPEKVEEVIDRIRKKQTTASQARLDPHAILLYPERTLLMNEPERIRTFQDTGAIVRQAQLQARERWFF